MVPRLNCEIFEIHRKIPEFTAGMIFENSNLKWRIEPENLLGIHPSHDSKGVRISRAIGFLGYFCVNSRLF